MHCVVGVNVKNLKSKFNKRQREQSTHNIHGREVMVAIEAGLLDSNKMLVPDLVNKDYRSWIEWKQFLKLVIKGRSHSIGISLRYLPWTGHWALQCLEYDAGRIYEQHRLVSDLDVVPSEYTRSHSELSSQITTALNIISSSNPTMNTWRLQCRPHHNQRTHRQQYYQGSRNMGSSPISSFPAPAVQSAPNPANQQRTMPRPA